MAPSCRSIIDVAADSELISSIEDSSFFPRAEEEFAWHLQSSTLWGIERPKRNTVLFRNPSYIRVKVWSDGIPPLAQLEEFLRTNRGIWIQCLWRDESGKGGVWIGDWKPAENEPSVKEMTWDGPCTAHGHTDDA